MDGTFWLVSGLGFLWALHTLSDSRSDTTRLERKVDLILKHLNLDPNQEVIPEIRQLLKAGKKIQAIKLYRQRTGSGLKDAKDYVESL
jgi:hypothetical protein